MIKHFRIFRCNFYAKSREDGRQRKIRKRSFSFFEKKRKIPFDPSPTPLVGDELRTKFAIRIIILFWLVAVFSFSGCGKKKTATREYVPARKKIVSRKPAKKVPAKRYVYQGYKNRNPFYPAGVGAPVASQVSQPEASSEVGDYRLTGIMTDMSGEKYAILSDANGANYILKNGWLYDSEGNRVSGVTGTVFENRVVIISGRKIKELKLPETSEPSLKFE